jgi:hypothetical protein
MTSCIKCPVGKYQQQSNSESCKDCPAGYEQKTAAKERCTECASARYSTLGMEGGCKKCGLEFKPTCLGECSEDSCRCCKQGKDPIGCFGLGSTRDDTDCEPSGCPRGFCKIVKKNTTKMCSEWKDDRSISSPKCISECERTCNKYTNVPKFDCEACPAGYFLAAM